MPRSRTKTDDGGRGYLNFDIENQLKLFSRRNSTRFRRIGSSRMRICFVLFLFLVLCSLNRLRSWRGRESHSWVLGLRPSGGPERTGESERILAQQPKVDLLPTPTTRNSTWRYPLVDRMMLHELDSNLQDFLVDFDISKFSNSDNHSSNDVQWQPRVTRLPEDPPRPPPPRPRTSIENINCETPGTQPQCRFLFPVRIAEQESKARIHLFQLAHLARRLNRTLVLPKVGKSKIGACFKWSFETYYDLDSFNLALSDHHHPPAVVVVDQEDFRSWVEGKLARQENPTTRLFSVGPSREAVKGELGPDRIRVHDVEPYDGWKHEMPGCLSKSRWLDGVHPTFITVAQPTRGGRSDLLGEAMVNALSDSESLSNGSEHPVPPTQVLILDWNLRHPLFPPSYNQQLLYSRNLVSLARRLAPSAYLLVHWRMETVDPTVLIDCAHALVDLLVRLLHDESIAFNITTVWFASDYPYPIARRTKTQPRPALEAKSGTFREFEMRHEDAVQVLRNAFDEGGELERWKVTDISEAMERKVVDDELLNDAGVLGILDKLIGVQANLFVSGSNRCARRSSFTTQIVDGRINTQKREDLLIGNIVDTFG